MVPWLATALTNIAVSFVIGKIMKPKVKEPDESLTYSKQPTLDDFRQPSCEYGVPIPKVFGTCILNGQILTNSAVEVKPVVVQSPNGYTSGNVGGLGGGDSTGGLFSTPSVSVPRPLNVKVYYMNATQGEVPAFPGSVEESILISTGGVYRYTMETEKYGYEHGSLPSYTPMAQTPVIRFAP